MKKILLLVVAFATVSLSAQTELINEGFEDITTLGWDVVNVSNPIGSGDWFQGNPDAVPANTGTDASSLATNFNATAGSGQISNWIILPVLSLKDGDVLSFYSRVPDGSTWADRVEVRLSADGAASTDPASDSDEGSYTTLLGTINPNLETGGVGEAYPETWTMFSYTIATLPTATDARLALRYFVPDGGPSGTNSNYVAFDDLIVMSNASASTDDNVLASNVSIYPTSVEQNFTINNRSVIALNTASIFDVNGRLIAQHNLNNLVGEKTINVDNLTSGIYFVELNSNNGKTVKKLIKK